MAELIWDEVGERTYETGLDRGVLYLPDGSAVPWNGLTSVIEAFDREVAPVYFDGMKINDLVTLGDFAATMKAVTYPKEFDELEGLGNPKHGIFLGDQKPKLFGLCYRVQKGNDLEGEAMGHKIHVLYNVTAIPNEKTYATLGQDPSLVEFEWNLTAVPEEAPGYRPTAHFIIETAKTDPWLLEEIESMLYGSSTASAALIPMQDLVSYIFNWFRIKITDNGDGTWTATTQRDGFISFGADDFFQIVGANAWYLDEFTYRISDTESIFDVPQIKIVDLGDGTWVAVTENDQLFSVDEDGIFEILNANAIFINADEYEVSDTTDEN